MDMDLPIPGEGGEDWGDTNMDFGRDSPVGGLNTNPDVERSPTHWERSDIHGMGGFGPIRSGLQKKYLLSLRLQG
jgi:hypothetical protein